MHEFNVSAVLAALHWPLDELSTEEIIARIERTNRFIDFDETIFDNSLRRPFDLLCGKPIVEFLGEEPFVLQTWNPTGAISFFSQAVDFPTPLLIIKPPTRFVTHPPVWYETCRRFITESGAKDFESLGLKNIIIIDDFVGSFGIHAPGCTLVAPR